MNKKLFGNHIEPACRYCAQGRLLPDGSRVLCEKRGTVGPDFKCRHYFYDPISRVPKKLPPLPALSDEDFSL